MEEGWVHVHVFAGHRAAEGKGPCDELEAAIDQSVEAVNTELGM